MQFKVLYTIHPNVLLCLNGTLPPASSFTPLTTELHSDSNSADETAIIVAADGAATQLRLRGIVPHSIVGDLDSVRSELDFWRASHAIIHEVEDQNSTDFEKSLEYILTLAKRYIIICGFHGGDLDHTLNNWSILQRYSKRTIHGQRVHLCVFDGESYAIPVHESVRFMVELGSMISIIPQPSVRLTTSGLEWNLINEVLAMGTREGARNRAVSEVITLEIHEGSILLFLKAQLPMMPIVVTEGFTIGV
jgi:thiamine pyrophosphokinase